MSQDMDQILSEEGPEALEGITEACLSFLSNGTPQKLRLSPSNAKILTKIQSSTGHSGIKFMGNMKKTTAVKPFSFNVRCKDKEDNKPSATLESTTKEKADNVKPIKSSRKPERSGSFKERDFPGHSGMKFFGTMNKTTAVKPFSFDTRCKDRNENKLTTSLETTTKEKADNSKHLKSSRKPERSASFKERGFSEHSGMKFAGTIKKTTAVKPFSFDARCKDKNENKSDASSKPRANLEAATTVKPLDSSKSELAEKKPDASSKTKANLEGATILKPLNSNKSEKQAENGIMKEKRVHSGLKLIPHKKTTVAKPFSFDKKK